MARLHRKSLVLRGVLVAREVVAVLERFAGSPADALTPVLSYPRHLSTRTPSTESDSPPRQRAVSNGVNSGARRAGRPGGPAGVPDRHPARIAGRTIPLGWSEAAGVVAPAAWCLDRLAVQRSVLAGRPPQRHSLAFTRRTQPTGSLTRLPVRVGSGTRGKAMSATLIPAARMPRASIRGK
jgi:hypothetical protein